MTQHKWHKEIHAWADGAEIEACSAGIWFSTDYPNWDVNNEFRIKPQPVEVVATGQSFRLKEKKYLYAYYKNGLPIDISFVKWSSYPGYEYLGKIEIQDD